MFSDRAWQGKWISAAGCPADAAPVFRRSFELTDIADTHVYISGVGFYVLKLNGEKVGDQLLAPAFSAYDKTVFYNEFDVTSLLQKGDNHLEVTLGNGWFREIYPTAWDFEHATWRSEPQFIFDLVTEGHTILCSDRKWQAFVSRTVFNSLRAGETYDASALEIPCSSVTIMPGPGGFLKKQLIPPVRVRRMLSPIAVTSVPSGAVYDFGENLSGNVEICVQGTIGQKATLLYTERTRQDGSADPANNNMFAEGGRFQQDEYILGSEQSETWHSQFCYHGFRYVQVTGDAQLISIHARCFHTDLPCAGGIETDFEPVQKLHEACVRSTLTNFHHIPTDCPHREKNGWTGDAHLSCEQALFNLDMKLAYQKYLDDLVDGQRPNGAISCISPTSIWGYNWGTGPTWDAALFEIPWQVYRCTGDKQFLARYQQPMERYLHMLLSMTDDHIYRSGLGDWCAPANISLCSSEALLTAYAWHMFALYSNITSVLGMAEKSDYAAKCAAEIKAAFQCTFIGREKNSQTYLALLLYFGLTDDPELVLRDLITELEKADWHMHCGIFGAKFMLNVLTDHGRFDIAWKLAMQVGFPSYLDMLSRCSGTLGEHWNGDNSQNHHMFSEIGAWFYKALAGIQLDEKRPGFEHILLTPHIPDEINHFTAWHNTPKGRLEISWDQDWIYIILPEGCTATIISNQGFAETQGTLTLPRSQFVY